MARVRLLAKDQTVPEIKELFTKIENGGAKVINLHKAIAHSPSPARNFIRLGNSLLSKTTLQPKLRELAILRVAKLTGSVYEWTQHVMVALECGLSQQQVNDITQWKESNNFNDEDRAILQYTDDVTTDVKVKSKTFDTLRKYLNEVNIVDLTMSIAYWGMVARILVALQVDIDKEPVGSSADLFGKRK